MPRVFATLLTAGTITCYTVLMINPNVILLIAFTTVVGALCGTWLLGAAVGLAIVLLANGPRNLT
jgi:hypothetical protein